MKRQQVLHLLPMIVTGVLITITGIIYHQSPLRILPLYVSLVIALLQSNVNRYANLLGGLNSILYGYVYYHYGLMASMCYALLASCPLQLIAFARWQKNAYKHSTVLRRMTIRQRWLVTTGFLFSWGTLFFILKAIGSSYQLFDNTVTLFGTLITVLMMLSYIEYTVLMIPSGLISIWMNVSITLDKPEMVTYVIFAVYSLYCQFRALSRARRLYQEQNPATKIAAAHNILSSNNHPGE